MQEVILMDNADVEKRLTILEDVEAIKRLKAECCDICDANHDQDRIVQIFAPDGIWESRGVGRAQGHDEIRKLFKTFEERISFSQHNVFNPRTEVSGDKAHGTWYFMGPFTFRKHNQAIWLAARYEEEYVKISGVWKFQHLNAIGRLAAPYETGWASSSGKAHPFSD